MTRRGRGIIWVESLTVLAVYAASILLVDRYAVGPRVELRPLAIALSFVIVQAGAITLILAMLFAHKERNVIRGRRTALLAPEIDDALARYSIGIDVTPRIAELRRESPDDVREGVLSFLATMTGEPHVRIAALAERLGIEGRSSTDAIDRARELIREQRYSEAIHAAAHESLLTRAVITEELEPYAGDAEALHLMPALRSDDRDVVVTALDMIRAWRRSVELEELPSLLSHADEGVRERALLALPYVATGHPHPELTEAVNAGARDKSPAVRTAAATAAAKLRLADAVPALAANMADPDDEVARASAFAVAAVGATGVLQAAIVAADRRAASFAFESIEKAAIGRLDLG